MRARSLRFIGICLLAAAGAALCGCASSPSSQGAGFAAFLGANRHTAAALPGKPGCFWLHDFDGSWTVLNDRELIVYAPFYSQPYLVKLFSPVPTLRFHERLGFADPERSGRICNGAMDDLVVPHWQPNRVPIVAVRALSLPEERTQLAQNHIKPRADARGAKGRPGGKR